MIPPYKSKCLSLYNDGLVMRDSFYCNCHEADHVLTVEYDEDQYVSFWLSPHQTTLWRRIKNVVRYLWKGEGWEQNDLILEPREYERLKDFMHEGENFMIDRLKMKLSD